MGDALITRRGGAGSPNIVSGTITLDEEAPYIDIPFEGTPKKFVIYGDFYSEGEVFPANTAFTAYYNSDVDMGAPNFCLISNSIGNHIFEFETGTFVLDDNILTVAEGNGKMWGSGIPYHYYIESE